MKKYSFLIFISILICGFVYAQTTSFTIQLNNGSSVTFPYQVNFSEAEIRLIKSLDTLTVQKLAQVVKLLGERGRVNTGTATSTTASSTIYSSGYSPQTPYYNPQTRQYQSKPVDSSGLTFPTYTPSPMTANSLDNPYRGSPLAQYYADSQNKYGNSPTGGHDNSMQALSSNDLKDLPKLGSGGESCTSNYGTTGVSLNGTTNRVKFDTNRVCLAFGKRLVIASAHRSQGCSSGSQHGCGTAIDPAVHKYGSREQQALLVVAYISLGYNVGSYEKDFPLHFDHEDSGKWKTWSRWAHTNGKAPLPYAQPVKDALNLIGYPADSAADFVSRHGRPTKVQMSAKAKAFLQSKYGTDAVKFDAAK